MKKLLIHGGTAIDPSRGLYEKLDILCVDGKVSEVGKGLSYPDAESLDATGMVVAPGLVDIHCHLREPGYEYKETIATGTRAAARGGFTSVCCMPNTKPVNDCAAVTRQIIETARAAGAVRVYPIGAITKGEAGKELTEVGELKAAGCVALSDDGKPVDDSRRMMLAMEYAAGFGMKCISHCEDRSLAADGSMHRGLQSTLLGLRGIPAAAEEIMVAREILLARELHVPVHIAHISTKGSVELVRWGKAMGVQVTAETCPHYLVGTDALVTEIYDTSTKVNPPLRTEEDREAIVEGLVDGTIDCIATDHAPHHIDEKNVEYASALSGISGFESALGLSYEALVASGHMELPRLLELMSVRPAQILNLPVGGIAPGAIADLAVMDIQTPYVLDPSQFISKGHNNPFGGMKLTARSVYTIVGGNTVEY